MDPASPTCKFCGEAHGPTLCRQELSLTIADERLDQLADHAELQRLRLEVNALMNEKAEAHLPHYHR